MTVVFLSSSIITLWLAMRGPHAWRFPTFNDVCIPIPVRYASATLLPLGFWLLIRVSEFQASHDGARDPWFATLPFPVVDDALPFGAIHPVVSAAAFCCVVLMSIALLMLCWTPPCDKGMCIATALSASFLALLAISAPVVTSTDPYFYVFAGNAGLATYAPPADLFNQANATMDKFIPLRGLIYGPLWITLNTYIVSFGDTLAHKIIALRIANVALLLATAGLLRGLGVSVRAQLALLLNPALWFYIVVNVHNDLMGLVPCLAAVIIAPRFGWAAVALVAMAGCIKLPFLVVGMPAFTRLANVRQTVVAIVCAVAMSLSMSWLFGGAPYVRDLLAYVKGRGGEANASSQAFTLSAAAVAVLLMTIAIFKRRFFAGAAYLTAYLSPFVFPWYLIWSLPYAISTPSVVLATLLAMPLAAALLDGTYDLLNVGKFVLTAIAYACIIDVRRARFSKRPLRK